MSYLQNKMENFKTMYEFTRMDYEHTKYGAMLNGEFILPFWLWLPVQRIGYFYLSVICKVKGHKLVDNDPCDPEVGMRPEVECTRCYKQFN